MNQMNSHKNSISIRRTYTLLKSALFEELTVTPIERITLTDLCSKSLIPRSTFYRYFEDKYDLLQYCLLSLVNELGLTKAVLSFQDKDSMKQFLRILICHLNGNMEQYRKIYDANKARELMGIIRNGLLRILTAKLKDAESENFQTNIPYPILTNLLADFFFSVIKCYLELAGQYDTETFIESVCRFADRDFLSKNTPGAENEVSTARYQEPSG